MKNDFPQPQRFSRGTLTPKQMMDAIEVLNQTKGVSITPQVICLLNQVKYLCKKEKIENTGNNPRCMEIVNKVLKVIKDHPSMVEVWFSWCKRENVRMDSRSAIGCFNKLYEAAINNK